MSGVNRYGADRQVWQPGLVAALLAVSGWVTLAAHPALSDRTTLFAASMTALALSWVAVGLTLRPGTPVRLPPSSVRWLTLAVAGSAVLSVAFSPAAGWRTLWPLGVQLMLLWMGYWLGTDRRSLMYLAAALGAGASASGLYAVLQFAGRDPLPAATPFAVHRVVASFANPNHLGNFQACVLPLGLAALLCESRSHSSSLGQCARCWLILAVLLFAYAGLLLSASRGAWVAAVAGVAVVLLGQAVDVHRNRAGWPVRWLVVVSLATALITISISRYPLVRNSHHSITLSQRALSTRHILSFGEARGMTGKPEGPPGDVASPADEAINHRYFIWEVTWHMIRTHPLWGIGYGEFGHQFGLFRNMHRRETLFRSLNSVAREQDTPHAHNEFLHTWAECGVLGLVSLLLLLGTGLAAAVRSAWQGPRSRPVLWGLVGLAVVMLVHSLVSYPMRLPLNGMVFWTTFGILLANSHQGSDKGPGGGPRAGHPHQE